MAIKFRLFCVALFLFATGSAIAQTKGIDSAKPQGGEASGARGGAWFSYRDVYRSMIRFEKYGGPKQFLQNHLRVAPTEKKVSTDGIRLTLDGKSIHLNLPLDPAGLAVFPMLKVAYDENAELHVNRPDGSVTLEPSVSIVVRPDGVYEVADLRAACDQVLQYLRNVDYLPYSFKHCAGVEFSYAKDVADVAVKFSDVEHVQVQLPVTEGGAFGGDSINVFKIVTFNFSDWPEKGQIVTNNVPLAIAATFTI